LQNAEADLRVGTRNYHTNEKLLTEFQTLIERFANNTSLDDLFDSISQIVRDANEDPELREWFEQLDIYIRRCLKEQGFIMQDASTEEWNQLYDTGRHLLREKYRGHTDRILDEFKFIGNQFDADPQNKAFAASLNTLFTALGNDESGKPAFKPHLIKDITEVILPGIFESVRYVPVPRIEYSDPMIDAVIENLVIESDNLAPNVFEFGSDNYWRWGRKKIASKRKNKVMLSVSGIQMDLRDVSYYIKRKQGSPKLTDKGVADIFLGGNGLSFKVEMENAEKGSSKSAYLYNINKISVDIKNVSIKLKQSNHKLLFSIFRPLLLKLMRPALEKVVEKQIRDNLVQFDALAYSVREEVKRAEAEALENPDPEHVMNMWQRYSAAINHQVIQGRKKVEEAVADKKVNMAVTQHDSIFKNISLPGGISTKATEFKELAAKGDKWESPVFSIGNASETRDLPKAAKIARKPHTTSGTAAPAVSSAPAVNGPALALDAQKPVGLNGVPNGNTAVGYGAVQHQV
jgi:hypothetical protein